MRRATCLGAFAYGTSPHTLYTAPAGKFGIVKAIVWRNYSSGGREFTIHFPIPGTDDFAGLAILAPTPTGAGYSGAIQPYLVVPSGKSIVGDASGTSCALALFGVELPE